MTTKWWEVPFLVFALVVALVVGGLFVAVVFLLGERFLSWAPVVGILLLVAPGWALQVRDRKRAAGKGVAQTVRKEGMPFLAFALLVAVAIAGTYILALFSLGEHIFAFWPVLWILMLVAPWWALQERDRRRAKRRDTTVALRYRTY